jgi:hypothetical protein
MAMMKLVRGTGRCHQELGSSRLGLAPDTGHAAEDEQGDPVDLHAALPAHQGWCTTLLGLKGKKGAWSGALPWALLISQMALPREAGWLLSFFRWRWRMFACTRAFANTVLDVEALARPNRLELRLDAEEGTPFLITSDC